METINAYLPELMGFYQVARKGGFSRAAEEMNLSKAQLSKQVARLEALLNVPLFYRTTRQVKLTNEGQHLLQYAERIFLLSKEAAESIKNLAEVESGVIRITAPSSLGDWFAPSLLTSLQKSYPLLKVEIDLSNAKRDLVNDGYDFALRAMTETNPDLFARYIGHIRDVIVCTPEFMKKEKMKLHAPQDLQKVNCLLNSHQVAWNDWKLQKGKQDMGVRVHGTYATTSYQTTKFLCLSHLGVARIPFYLVQAEIKNKRLLHLLPEYHIATHPLYLVYPAGSEKIRRRKIFRDFLLEWLKGQKEVFQSV